jgi:tetratricopeptide (TPR) repeat protein
MDVANDKDFPELQGYFPIQKNGTLYAHFAFLVSNPAEPLNIALAGPKWFQVQKDGIGFWLLTKNGYLHHYSDSMPKKLFKITPFVWYIVDLDYNIDEGRYDLIIRQEGQESPLVDLKQQANTPNATSSSVNKFSFIGDLADRSNVVYYLDDVIIGTDKDIITKPFIAPGRRKLFFDYLQDYHAQIHSHPVCLPVDGLADLGIDRSNEYLLDTEGAMIALLTLLDGITTSLESFKYEHPDVYSFLNAVKQWRQGCSALAAGETTMASDHFRAAIQQFDSPLYQLTYAMALAESGRYDEAVAQLGTIYSYWADDPRYAITQTMVALTRKDWQKASWIVEPQAIAVVNKIDMPALKELWAGRLNGDLIASFREELPSAWAEALGEFVMAEQYFYLLLWTGRHYEALEYAQAMVDYLAQHELPTTLWQERIGDSHFISGNYTTALQQYQEIQDQSINKSGLYKKISDIAFKQGDTQTERHYRELVYGNLRP